ncbi:protein kinase domain-containing protein [Luedemannella helvata]|uniref:Protein kinase domain-containing protein n=1 Tax=Luedemannella helvata TaxID=349315 RepID=A0ABP4XCY5_9ACTN
MTGPRQPRELDETLLDPGRARQFPQRRPRDAAGLAPTLVDAGRRRPGGGEPLSAELAGRYDLDQPLNVPASQADLFLARDGNSVLKRYHQGGAPIADVSAYLATPRPHVARYLEFGPDYEILEYLPHGTLLDRRATDPTAFDFAALREVAQQLATVLIHMHRQGLVHRDIKPANIMIRTLPPLDLAVVDFGVAGRPGEVGPVGPLNPAYQPPESVLLGQFHQAGDWWSLGMTLLELAAGEHPFEGLTREDIRSHFGSARSVDVSGVPDEPGSDGAGRQNRLRNLCQGLLTSDPAQRWGEPQVSKWLVGLDPDVPGMATRPFSTAAESPNAATAVGAEQPYVFNGIAYHYRDELAQALATAWNHAVEVLFTRDGPLEQLRTWLEQFTDADGLEAGRVVDDVRENVTRPASVRLLQVVQALDPTRPPTYRHHVISRQNLQAIAHRAFAGDHDARSVLADLWTHHLLPMFDTAAPIDPDRGAEGLTDVDHAWRAEVHRLVAAATALDDAEARDYVNEQTVRPNILAACLRAALDDPADAAAARGLVRRVEAELPVAVPWFSALTGRRDLVWLALVLAAHATSRAQTVHDRRRADEAAAETDRNNHLFREWSRRQNRPVAAGWAVAGVCFLVAGWIALLTASDAAGWATDTDIGLGWVGAAVCAGVSLVAECLFAMEVGGRFHPRFSMSGAGPIALRPLGRWLRRAWLPASLATLAVLAGMTAAAVRYPQAIAAATTVGHLAWLVRRWLHWRRHRAEQDARHAAAERRWPPRTPEMPEYS